MSTPPTQNAPLVPIDKAVGELLAGGRDLLERVYAGFDDRVVELEQQHATDVADLDRLGRELATARVERDLAETALREHLATHHQPAPVARLKPVEIPDPTTGPDAAAAARKLLPRLPAEARFVGWDAVAKPGDTLEDVFIRLAADDILVLPERREPYLLDASDGFRAAGVSAVLGAGGKRLPIVSTYKGKAARTWFAMARARRGIIGLGPGARIELTETAWRQERQLEDKGSTLPGGGTSPGRQWWNTSGAAAGELVGAQEKLIESNHPDSYFGNFTVRARDLGGIAFHGIGATGTAATFERLDLDDAWRGFSAVPNGETGAITVNRSRYVISRCSTSPLDAQGRRVGSSPIMVNNSPGGLWEHGDSSQAVAGMPTIWRSSGRHDWVDVTSRWGATGVNLEDCLDDFTFRWTGGICWPNRGGKGGHPAPDGIHGNSLHLGLNARGRASVELADVDLDDNVQPGKLCVQLYGNTDPAKIHIIATRDEQPVPVAAYGKGGVVKTA